MKLSPEKIGYGISVLLLFSYLVSGCALMQVREEAEMAQHSTVLVGNVSSSFSSWEIPVVVAAYSKETNKRTIVHHTTLHELGSYELFVPKGNFYIVAFGDKNKNSIYDKGEPAGQYLNGEQVTVPAGGVVGDLHILISNPSNGKIDLPLGSVMPPKKFKTFHCTSPGAIATLEDALFSDEYGNNGLWTPLEFFKEIGGNIYFLEPYDPKKIPILFVHGAAGSPQNWKSFFDSIDREKYQPWFYYYPSGSSINSMSYLLYWKIHTLQCKYKFNELYITAHSMGGLVVRSFLVNFGHLFPSISNFISISTPWGGEQLAETGVKYSPGVIPVWRDMQPKSEFLNSIYSRKLPSTVDFFLFFGHKGNRNLLRPNNDKAVTLVSQLDQRAQSEAKMVYGFHEDHVSILSSEQVLSQYNAILAAAYEKSSDAVDVLGNNLRVDFSFDLPKERVWPHTTLLLLLRSMDEKRSETWFYLKNEDKGKELGPFPSGNYEVSLVASSFVPEPLSIPITIEEGIVPDVKFLMKSREGLVGYVVSKEKSIFQVGDYRRPDREVQIHSMTLKGVGITRTLIPMKEEDFKYADHYLSGIDYLANGTFCFFGLPVGEYELTIKAEGYEPYTETRNVSLGQYDNPMLIELVEETMGQQ